MRGDCMVRFLSSLVLGLLCSHAISQTADELAALKSQKEAMEYQAAIEKAKAEIAKARQDQIRAALGDVTLAEEAKKKAEAERAEFLAKLPPVEAKALPGTVGVEGIKLLALPPILSRLDSEAKVLCGNMGPKVLIYDKAVVDGITAAVVVQEQMANLDGALNEALKPKEKQAEAGRAVPLLALYGVTTAVKAGADLASLFKTNIITGKVDL